MAEKANWFQHHFWEIIFAFIFAVVAGVFFEILKKPAKRSKLLGKVQNIVKKIRTRGRRFVPESSILNSINTNFNNSVSNKLISDAIYKHHSLYINEKHHYADVEKKYHAQRRFLICSTVNGDEFFFRELCREMAAKLHKKEIPLFLSLKKESNRIFAQEFVGNNFPGRIKWHSINCYEKRKGWPFNTVEREFKYEEGDTLDGLKIILLESFLLFPDTIIEAIKWVQNQGASVEGIIVLFDGSGGQLDFSSCGFNPDDVIIGCFIDLKTVLAQHCACKNGIKVLKYNNI